jgi:hypothetical protein
MLRIIRVQTPHLPRVGAAEPGRAVRWLEVALPLAIGAVWAVSLTQLRLQNMTDLGLISAMPLLTLACLGALTISFAIVLHRRPLSQLAAATHVIVLIVVLYGLTEFVEPIPRFGTVYHHVGIISVLQTRNAINPHLDAYFNWPGFFAFGDLLVKLAGWRNALAFAAWGPLFYNLLFLPPLLMIFRWATGDARLQWLAAWMFFSANWVAQDYVSPQATAFLLWLAMLALILRYFVPSPRRSAAAASARATIRQFGPRALRVRARTLTSVSLPRESGVLLVVLLLYGAIVSGHQLTPVPAILATTAIAAFAGLKTRSMPVVMIVGAVAWLIFMATAYLEGNFNALLGPLSQVGGNLTQSVGGRLGGSPDHQLIVKLNAGFSAIVWSLSVAGFVRRLRAGRLELAYVLVAVTPFVIALVQPYGGEIFLRVYLFALPAAAFFAACLFFPSESAGRRWMSGVALAAIGCAVLYVFQYPRYGNERFTAFTPADVAAVRVLYRVAPLGSLLLPGTSNLPWEYRDYDAYRYGNAVDTLPEWSALHPQTTVLLAELRQAFGVRGGYFIVTPSEEIYAESFAGAPGVLPRLVAAVAQDPGVSLLYQRDGASIFRFPPSASGVPTTPVPDLRQFGGF